MSAKNPILLGRTHCSYCGSDYVRMDLLNMGRTPGIDHVDIYCQVCKKFINHMNVIPFVVEASEQEGVTSAMINELNKELENVDDT